MNSRKITYHRLEKVLRKLGYEADRNGSALTFRHPNSDLPVILPNKRRIDHLSPVDLVSVRNTLANSGLVSKEHFESLFDREPMELWHDIIDAEAEYRAEHGHPPTVLKLPIIQAYDLAKLRRNELGELAERVFQNGIKVFEQEGLLNTPVELVPSGDDFVFE